jgi:hypothetical protein
LIEPIKAFIKNYSYVVQLLWEIFYEKLGAMELVLERGALIVESNIRVLNDFIMIVRALSEHYSNEGIYSTQINISKEIAMRIAEKFPSIEKFLQDQSRPS